MESDMINTGSDGGRGGIPRMQAPCRRTTGPTRRSSKGQWTADEDEILRKAVQRFQGKNWKKIAEFIKDRTDVQCLHRWQKVLNPDLVKGPWSKEEDDLIKELVKKYGAKKWSTIARHMPGRIGKQCRERWHNHLNPNINKDAWTQEEELILIQAHQIYGNKWAELMKFLPGRTDNAIKNHWNSAVKKKLDSYVASGLLVQLQGLPQVTVTGQSLPSSSSTAQWSCEDDNVPKDGDTEAEEISECSQEITENSNTKFEEVVTLPVQELPSEMDELSNFIGHSNSHNGDNSATQKWKINPNELSNISSLDPEHSLLMNSVGTNENNGLMAFPQQLSLNNPENMIYEEDCFGDVYPELDMNGDLFTGNFGNCSNVADFSGPPLPLHYQLFSDAPHFVSDPNQFNGVSHRSQQDDLAKSLSNGSFHENNYVETILECGKRDISPQDEQGQDLLQILPVDIFSSELPKDSPKLVPVNVPNSKPSSSNNETNSPKNEFLTVTAEGNDRGSLCYDPPCFPSLDIPFFSCDLLQAGDDVNQDYSPFGIRRLMMSSVNCLSPIRLWDSPTRDSSSSAVLKSAAKAFTCTPSILKKRNRDLISPISEKRDEKRPEMDMDQELFSDLARDFSRLDVLFFENANQKAPIPSHGKENMVNRAPDKENQICSREAEKEDGKARNMDKTATKDDVDESNLQNQVPQPLEILVEHNMNDMLFLSPDPFGVKSQNINLGNQRSKWLGCTSSVSLVISPVVSKNKDKGQVHHPEAMFGSSGNDFGVENSIFSDTPLKRSFESPSAWKSPWFFNSFIPGPRVDTNISVEDIGYFLSPGNRSVDAVELMKQLSEQSSDAFAGAQKVLGDETPETILRGIHSKKQEKGSPRNYSAPNSLIASNVLTEKRVLDFSDCGTPGKEKQSSKTFTSMTLSSPSYLLKSCR